MSKDEIFDTVNTINEKLDPSQPTPVKIYFVHDDPLYPTWEHWNDAIIKMYCEVGWWVTPLTNEHFPAYEFSVKGK